MPHSHDHGACEHEADGIDPLEMGLQYSLFQKIDMINLECLNEAVEDSGKKVFKPYEMRLDFTDFVASDCDQELLFNIPFTGNIKLKGIRVIGPSDGSHPKKVRLFKNRPKMTFDDTSAKPEQEFELDKDLTGSIEYNTQVIAYICLTRELITMTHSKGCEVQLGPPLVAAFPNELWRRIDSHLLHRLERRVQ